MAAVTGYPFKDQLLDRRKRLDAAARTAGDAGHVRRLIDEVDAALDRLERGVYGYCETCHDPIEPERLLADPTVRFCVDHLTREEQRALESDMELASRIQRELLPKREACPVGWQMHYHYKPVGVVSGDYCDVVPDGRGGFFFAVGDVSGKGVAASMLMAHLQAMFRALISVRIPLGEMMERASRLFCESTMPAHFATLVCGIAGPAGEVELCNAGHPPPLWLHGGQVRPQESAGLPIGLFCSTRFEATRLQLVPGDALLLYTDGAVETENAAGEEYGVARLSALLTRQAAQDAGGLVAECLKDLEAFGTRADDLTLLAIRRNTVQ